MEEEGALCQTCFAGTLQLTAGILVCETCGVTQQNFLEETQEYQGTTRRTQVRAAPGQYKPEWKEVEERKKLPVQAGIEAYVCAFQDLLQVQISQMVRLGLVSDMFPNVVEDLWFLYLRKSKILEPAFFRVIEKDVLESENKVQGDDSKVQFSRARAIVTFHMNKFLPLSLSLSVLFLGSWETRETIDPYDICRLAAMGHLEFLGFWKRFKSDLEPYMSIFPRSFVCRTGVSSPAKIYSQSRHLANYIGLKCPCLNIMAWNMRYLSSLSVSQEMLAPLSLCYLSYGASVSSSDYSICDEYKTPWAILAAKSAVYLDIILSSTSEREQVNGIIRRCLEENILGGSHLMPNTIDASKVSRLTLEELNQFVKFLERVYFQFEPVEGLEFITNKLKRMTANERCREAPTSKRFPSVNTVLDKIPTIRQASPQSPSYTLVQLALCHLSWSSMKYTILISRRQPQTIFESEIIASYHGNKEEERNIKKWRDHAEEYRSKRLELEKRARQIYRSFS